MGFPAEILLDGDSKEFDASGGSDDFPLDLDVVGFSVRPSSAEYH